MSVPRLRNEMKEFDWKGQNYNQILKNLEDLVFLVKSQMVEEDLMDETKQFKEEKKNREKFKMNQTFNMTHTSMVDGFNSSVADNVTPTMN